MGVLNVTPDSFSDGGIYFGYRPAIDAAMRMIDEGADLIDVGGESTKPGAPAVPLGEELARTIPVVERLAKKGIAVSIDTRKPEVARVALASGAAVVNDVSGFRDSKMAEVCISTDCSVCIMHMKGDPETMQASPEYEDVVGEICQYLTSQARAVEESGIDRERIWIDPGIGFGKLPKHNLAILRGMSSFVETGYPVMVGVSRKSFIGKILGSDSSPVPVGDRLEGTIAADVWAQIRGAKILRVHDVKEARRAAEIVSAILLA